MKTDGVEEYWHSHGEYFGKSSEECWEPAVRQQALRNTETGFGEPTRTSASLKGHFVYDRPKAI